VTSRADKLMKAAFNERGAESRASVATF